MKLNGRITKVLKERDTSSPWNTWEVEVTYSTDPPTSQKAWMSEASYRRRLLEEKLFSIDPEMVEELGDVISSIVEEHDLHSLK